MSLETFQQPEPAPVLSQQEQEIADAVEAAHEGATGFTQENHLADKVIGPDGTLMTQEEANNWDNK